MGGKAKAEEPTVTQAPTKTPGQTQFLSSLLGMMGGYMGQGAFGQMPTLGERYGGGRPAPGATMGAAPGGKGGAAPGTMQGQVAPPGALPPGMSPGQGGQGQGGMLQGGPPPEMLRAMQQSQTMQQGQGQGMQQPGAPPSGLLSQLLAGPIISPFTQGQTGNFPRRPMGGGR